MMGSSWWKLMVISEMNFVLPIKRINKNVWLISHFGGVWEKWSSIVAIGDILLGISDNFHPHIFLS